MTDRYSRFHERTEENLKDRRSPGRRDRDRILYSSAFRRLSGITQVVAPTERHPIHNRLTHSLEVGQIGRSIAEDLLRTPEAVDLAEALGGLDPDVVEAAALAHDLGHPPFGHVTEMELDELVKKEMSVADGFEGNAQSFRIVTKLAVRYPDVDGLNLTRATLNAVLKYPWLRGTMGQKAKKWGAYGSEEKEFAWARALMPAGSESKSLEADLMDFSPILEPYRGTREDRARVRSFTSGLIDRYVSAVALNPTGDVAHPLVIDRGASMEVAMLKSLTWHYVIESRSLTAQRFGQRSLIRSLFKILCDAASVTTDWHIFPETYQDMLTEAKGNDEHVVRTVADLISSMAEAQLIELHQRITGHSLGSAMDPIVP